MLRRTANPATPPPRDEFTGRRVIYARALPVNAMGMTRIEAAVYAKYRACAERGWAAPTMRTIARQTGYSHGWVREIINRLERAGHIKRHGRANSFRVTITATGKTTRPINVIWRE